MIKGEASLLYIDFGIGMLPIACLTEHSFSEAVSEIPTTTLDNKGWETSQPTNQSYNISFSGILKSDINDPSIISYYKLLSIKRGRIRFDWEILTTDNDGVLYKEYGKGFFNSIENNAPAGEFITFSGGIKGYGQPFIATPNSGNTWDSTLITFDSTVTTFDET